MSKIEKDFIKSTNLQHGLAAMLTDEFRIAGTGKVGRWNKY